MIRNAEAEEWSKDIVKTQMEWLDKAMFRLLPEKFHYKVRQGNVSDTQIQEWLRENGVQITFFRNVPMIRITIKGQLFDEWKLQLQVDGRPVDAYKVKHPEEFGDDIWVDGEGPKKN